MIQYAVKLERLLAAYIRVRQPNARHSDIAAAIETLRERIERGELRIEAVIRRLEHEVGEGRVRTPTAFGDIARAVRDLDGGRLSMAERRFVSDMVGRGFGFRPSIKQNAWLRALFDRLGRRAA